jgi:hypothetical protein
MSNLFSVHFGGFLNLGGLLPGAVRGGVSRLSQFRARKSYFRRNLWDGTCPVGLNTACARAKSVWLCTTNFFWITPVFQREKKTKQLRLVKNLSGRWDSNPRQPAWEAGTLPLSYTRSVILILALSWLFVKI